METDNLRINREHKDRMFRWIFKDKRDLLELYNAVNGTSYTDPEQLEINTLEDVVYIGMKNDMSFLITDVLNLYEHQSSYNPNMPFREFLYLGDVYRKYAKQRNLNILSSTLQKLPMPQCIVFYNGLQEEPDRKELLLSDAFIRPEKDRRVPSLELRVLMLNINWGHNRELMEKCEKLKEYAQFIAQIRQNSAQGMSREAAVIAAVDTCIESGILKEMLSQHKAEVMDMLLTEYNEQEHMAMERKEWYEIGQTDGMAKGLEKGRTDGILESKQEDILEILAFRGDVPDDIRQLIVNQTDLDVLKAWHRKAIAAPSISDFIQSLNQN